MNCIEVVNELYLKFLPLLFFFFGGSIAGITIQFCNKRNQKIYNQEKIAFNKNGGQKKCSIVMQWLQRIEIKCSNVD